jgi:hypothetical protein
MKKNLLLTSVFSLLLNGVLFSQIVFQNGSFEMPDDSIKYTANGLGGGNPTKMDDNLIGWWADTSATDCGRESVKAEGTVPDGRYVGFAFNNDSASIWNLAGKVEPGMRDLYLTFYVQESWPQNLTDMTIVIKFATYEGTDTTGYVVVDSLGQLWDKTTADVNGFVFYEFSEVLPATTEGKNLLISFDIARIDPANTWVNFDNFELGVSLVVGIQNTSVANNTKVYPNPASDFINIGTKVNEVSTYRLIDVSGKEMLTGFVNNNGRIDVSSLQKGIYLLYMHNSLGTEVIKTVIK